MTTDITTSPIIDEPIIDEVEIPNVFEWTEQQLAIFDEMENTDENIAVIARAGCGKTTTGLESIYRVKTKNYKVMIAFNRAIANEFKIRFFEKFNIQYTPSTSTYYDTNMLKAEKELADKHKIIAKTLNGLGSSVLKSRLFPDNKVEYKIDLWTEYLLKQVVSPTIAPLFALKPGGMPEFAQKVLISKLSMELCKFQTTTDLPPAVLFTEEEIEALKKLFGDDVVFMADDDFTKLITEKVHTLVEEDDQLIASSLFTAALKMRYRIYAHKLQINPQKELVFNLDDQIYLPAMLKRPLNVPPRCTFVDEAQDFSPIQQLFLKKLKPSRLVVIGDPKQALYQFRGADTKAMGKMIEDFKCKEMPLTYSFRLPRNVLAVAKTFCSDIESLNPNDGLVEENRKYFGEYGKNVAMIAFGNKGLIKSAIAYMMDGDKKGETRTVNYSGDRMNERFYNFFCYMIFSQEIPVTPAGLREAIQTKLNAIRAKIVDPGASENAVLIYYEEMLDVLDLLLNGNKTSVHFESVGTLRKILVDRFGDVENGLNFTTVHKSKGLEWDTVLVNMNSLKDLKMDQEEKNNLCYVAITRSKNEVYYNTEMVLN